MIQLMPEATEEVAGIIEDRMAEAPSVTQMLADGMTAEDILFYLTQDFSMIMQNETTTPKYECKCSTERMRRAVISIGKEELRKIIDEDGKCEVECQFCNNKYVFEKAELLDMLEKAK
jgi:molecular chaperone Hsp33